jgi:hypothetical protein
MKKLLLLTATMLLGLGMVQAQAATRPVVLTWQAPATSGYTGYNVYGCTVVSPATSCTPSVTGTPLNAAPLTTATYTYTAATQAAYGFSVVALYPPCSGSSGLTTACGSSTPDTLGYVPVPPQGTSGSNLVIVVP